MKYWEKADFRCVVNFSVPVPLSPWPWSSLYLHGKRPRETTQKWCPLMFLSSDSSTHNHMWAGTNSSKNLPKVCLNFFSCSMTLPWPQLEHVSRHGTESPKRMRKALFLRMLWQNTQRASGCLPVILFCPDVGPCLVSFRSLISSTVTLVLQEMLHMCQIEKRKRWLAGAGPKAGGLWEQSMDDPICLGCAQRK